MQFSALSLDLLQKKKWKKKNTAQQLKDSKLWLKFSFTQKKEQNHDQREWQKKFPQITQPHWLMGRNGWKASTDSAKPDS
jgi:hypothetical protein